MSGIPLLIAFVVMIVLMIVAISRFKVHPFLSLMGASLILALLAGIPLTKIPGVIGAGFSAIFSSLGIVIILGAMIGYFLEKTGAALKMADAVVRMVGRKHPETAILLMGWIISIPVFCDSGFVILNPIRRAITRKTGVSSVAMTVALSAGLYTSHVLIPPTPGPIAAADALGLGSNLMLVIGMGALVSVPVLIAAYLYARFIGKRLKSAEDEDKEETLKSYEELVKEHGKLPGTFASFMPIVLPVVLMSISSIFSILRVTGPVADLFTFLGTPMIALAVGLLSSICLLASSRKMSDFLKLSEETLKTVGPILFVTAAGGVLGRVITEAGITTFISQNAAFLTSVGIFFPFLFAAILKTAQGSSTVAIITTASLMGVFSAPDSLMASLGLTTPVRAALTVMAIGAGAMTVSHANDSYFWVVTNFGRLKAQDGYKTQTMVTLVMGIVAVLFIWLLSIVLV